MSLPAAGFWPASSRWTQAGHTKIIYQWVVSLAVFDYQRVFPWSSNRCRESNEKPSSRSSRSSISGVPREPGMSSARACPRYGAQLAAWHGQRGHARRTKVASWLWHSVVTDRFSDTKFWRQAISSWDNIEFGQKCGNDTLKCFFTCNFEGKFKTWDLGVLYFQTTRFDPFWRFHYVARLWSLYLFSVFAGLYLGIWGWKVF